MNKKKQQNYLWQISVVILLVLLIAQSAITYQVLKRDKDNLQSSTDPNIQEVKLVPRQAPTPPQKREKQISALSQKRQLAMPPLPNVGRQSQPSQRMQQCPALQQHTASVTPNNYPNRHIMMSHQDPFGMDIREEMARMEKFMDAMMQGMHSRSMFSGMMDEDPWGAIGSLSNAGTPSLSVDKDKNYVVQLQIPGLDKAEVKATVSGNILTVSGVQREEQSNSGQGMQSYISSSSSFQNSFALPGPAKAQGLKLDYQGDTLTIRIPKA